MRMTRFGVGVAVALAGLGLQTSARAGDVPQGVHIQVVQGLFRDVPPGMVKIIGRPLKDLITKRTGLTGDIDTAPDAITLADRLKAGKCQLGVFHGYEFAWARERNPDLVPLVVTVPPVGKPQACVVVRKDSKATCLGDLKNEAVTVPLRTKGHCFAYLERARTGFADGTAAPKNAALTAEGALDAVVSGESPAALLDVSLLAGYRKIQPGASQNLRILCESEEFPQNVIAYSKGAISEETAAQLREVLTTAHTTPAGKPLMALWAITNFDAVPADYSKQLDKIAKDYPSPATVPTGTAGSGGLSPR